MRVLIFSLSYFPMTGGAEVAIKEITDRIPHEKIQFDLVTLRFNRSDLPYERVGNIDVHRIGGGWGYLSKILFVIQAAFFANRRKYDLYWAMMTNMVFPISLLRFSGIKTPYVLTLQDGDPFEYVFERKRIKLFKPLLISGFKNAKVVQAISNFLAGWAKRMGAKGEVLVIPNGVETKRFENHEPHVTPEIITLITVSRLVEKNAIGDVLEALKFMPGNIKFQVLGAGPLEKELKEKARTLGVEKWVEFLGLIEQKDIPEYLHKADIFIRPSLSEGQGISFIEAMAAGLPVIATPVGGIPDFLKDGETGLMVEPKNPRAIAFQVQKLISDRVLRDKITINALRMVREKYDWDLIASEMENRVFVV